MGARARRAQCLNRPLTDTVSTQWMCSCNVLGDYKPLTRVMTEREASRVVLPYAALPKGKPGSAALLRAMVPSPDEYDRTIQDAERAYLRAMGGEVSGIEDVKVNGPGRYLREIKVEVWECGCCFELEGMRRTYAGWVQEASLLRACDRHAPALRDYEPQAKRQKVAARV